MDSKPNRVNKSNQIDQKLTKIKKKMSKSVFKNMKIK